MRRQYKMRCRRKPLCAALLAEGKRPAGIEIRFVLAGYVKSAEMTTLLVVLQRNIQLLLPLSRAKTAEYHYFPPLPTN